MCLHGKWLVGKPEQEFPTMESMLWRNAGAVAGDENDKMWCTPVVVNCDMLQFLMPLICGGLVVTVV